ncbi:phosphate--nucleotide phosphotransferase [Labilibaculum filiforme]|uniref:Phosphate--nucleotide phosphotransferase n=1 Tax=Labilibaculum filiforme TaxID=1940526 RepID=A0A2N3I266_9BACT|nr:PPK2 family polyphosphate kinase [Labilibaculum filiforme]PKQ64377.1 phosphate--nucleotide phosphotransferase [Labilibaculum filiforme]
MNIDQYKISKKINLAQTTTFKEIEDAKEKLKQVRRKISELQDTMYAHGKYNMLICLQGMDTSGKDSLVREVFKDVNARGVVVHSFKAPTSAELKHDFLWRHYVALPMRGKICVFNRTHYENVLVTRVHPEYILGENIPSVTGLDDLDDAFYHKRMERIVNFEEHIAESGTIILKFFLHLSKDEQKRRLLRRLRKKNKNWKFSKDDLNERKSWDAYQECYEDAINRTSNDFAPWYIVPADDKATSRLIVAESILQSLKKYKDMVEPTLDEETLSHLDEFERQLKND